MLFGRFVLLLSETDAKYSQEVAIRSLDINVSLNKSLPFLHHGTELVSGQIHAVELG